MEAPSFVSRARTAFHSAAARAERVLTDIKSDLKHDRDCSGESPATSVNPPEYEFPVLLSESKSSQESKHLRWKPSPISLGKKQDWHNRLRNIGLGKKGVDETEKDRDSTMSFQIYDDNLYTLNEKIDIESKSIDPTIDNLLAGNVEKIPPYSVVKQLGFAIENGRKSNSVKDFVVSSKGSSPVRERVGLSLSAAVRSLVLREKEEKEKSERGNDEKVNSLIKALFDTEADFLGRKIGSDADATSAISLAREIHAAPPESFVVKVAEVIGSFKTMERMALFWSRVVEQLQRLWLEELHVAGIPLDQIPDLHSCLLYQQLQVINCCISRKRRHSIAKESLDTAIREASPNRKESHTAKYTTALSPLYARIGSGELVLRLGADHQSDIFMLETGEPIYSPVTQECPLLTEETIKETEEFVLRTGSVGAGCSQLLSDMQAFKAANPGCILEDFVRWHSPPDWTDAEERPETDSSSKGQLSRRMQKEGNLWRELWETSKPVPAVNQTPLFDGDLAVEGILNFLEDIPPLQLFEQLFVSLIGLGLGIAEASIVADSNILKLFYECKDYVVATCQGSSSIVEKVDDLCQVYETVEMMLLKPDEVLKMINQGGDDDILLTTPAQVPSTEGGRFKRLISSFGSKDKNSYSSYSKEQELKSSYDNCQPFSSILDNKSSLFSKKPPPRSGVTTPAPDNKQPANCSDENEWTIVEIS